MEPPLRVGRPPDTSDSPDGSAPGTRSDDPSPPVYHTARRKNRDKPGCGADRCGPDGREWVVGVFIMITAPSPCKASADCAGKASDADPVDIRGGGRAPRRSPRRLRKGWERPTGPRDGEDPEG